MPPEPGAICWNSDKDTLCIWDGEQWLTVRDGAIETSPVFRYKHDAGTFRIDEIQNLKKIDIEKRVIEELGQKAAEHQDRAILAALQERIEKERQEAEKQRKQEEMRRFKEIAFEGEFEKWMF